MKVLIPLISFGKSGGIKVISNLANYWIKQGHIVTIVTAADDTPYYATRAEIVFISQGKNDKTSVLKKLYLLFDFIRRESINYDVVLANYNLTAYPVFFGSKVRKAYYIQAYEPEFYSGIKNNLIKRIILTFAAWFTYCLPMLKIVNSDMYRSYKNIRTKNVVYPGINLDVFFPKKRSHKDKEEIFQVGCIGRQEEWKGSEDVAEAIRILHAKGFSNVELVVAFNPVAYERHKLVQPHGDSNLAEFYRSLDIMVTPGHVQLEAIHYPVIEAMATKTPLITTGYYPSAENNCFLVPVKSANKIAEKIQYIIENYDQAIEKADLAYEDTKRFSWENVSKKFISLLN